MKKEEFLQRIKRDYPKNFLKYDYSELPENFFQREYAPIICKIHGKLKTHTYSSHLLGKGCKKCATEIMRKKIQLKPEEFFNRVKKIMPQYDYSKSIYNGVEYELTAYCPIHNKNFTWLAKSFLEGCGCPDCLKEKRQQNPNLQKTTEQFIKEAKEKWNNPYLDYSKTIYNGSEKEITVICHKLDENDVEHGDFTVLAYEHLRRQCCPKCSSCLKTTEQFIQEAKVIHDKKRDILGLPRYDYSKVKYIGAETDIIINCPIHGNFNQLPNNHLKGHGCDKCGNDISSKKQSKSTEQFIQEAKVIHDKKRDILGLPRYDYSITEYINSELPIDIICPIHKKFTISRAFNHLTGSGCQACNAMLSESYQEKELVEFIKSIYSDKILLNNRNIINPQELDIYIPENNIAIEYNGIYYHSNIFKEQTYHLKKTNDCEKQGIQLIHIFEDEWLNKQEIVKARLLNLLGKNKFSIGARKLILKQVPVEKERNFLNNNHLQGYVASQICYGLYYQTKDNRELLVCLMSFGQLRKNLGSSAQNGVYELYRFVTAKRYSVPGGASRLFKHFIKQFNPKQIISFADRRWSIKSERNLYEQLGFKFDSYTEPNYFYVQGTKRINRFALRKDVLIKEYGCPTLMSEREFTEQMGWPRIYDCGNLKYIWSV